MTKLYVGQKMVKATPMNRLEYNNYRGWELPADEDGSDEGYLVEHLNAGKANHPNHTGYISWSPSTVFEQTYLEVESSDDALPHMQRVAAEYAQLVDRIQKLEAFFKTSLFRNLDIVDQDLLFEQLRGMVIYRVALKVRLMKDKQNAEV